VIHQVDISLKSGAFHWNHTSSISYSGEELPAAFIEGYEAINHANK